jgi:glycosyltransferase involved in cell wall biosynthesis
LRTLINNKYEWNRRLETPKVSIMIPTYNHEHYIEQAIVSASTQDYPNLEIIISDDSSTDRTGLWAQRHITPNVKYFCNEERIGRVANYRKLLYKYATGDYVIMLDGDDYYTDSSYITKAVKMIKDLNVSMVFAKMTVLANDKLRYDKINNDLPVDIDGTWFFMNWQIKGIIHPDTALYKRREAIDADVFYNYDVLNADSLSIMQFIQGRKLGFINEFVAVWRKHATNETNRRFDIEVAKKNLDYLIIPYRLAAKNPNIPAKELAAWYNKRVSRYALKITIGNAELGEWMSFIKEKLPPTTFFLLKIQTKILKVILKFGWLARFIFKHIIKNESFYENCIVEKIQ